MPELRWLIPALAASSALPSLTRPVVLHGRTLIDGGFVNPVPYDVVMHRADVTVAIDVTGEPRQRPGGKSPRTLDAVTGATQILFHSITRAKLKSAAPDILIRPAVGGFRSMDYFKIEAILAAATPAKDELKRIEETAIAPGDRPHGAIRPPGESGASCIFATATAARSKCSRQSAAARAGS